MLSVPSLLKPFGIFSDIAILEPTTHPMLRSVEYLTYTILTLQMKDGKTFTLPSKNDATVSRLVLAAISGIACSGRGVPIGEAGKLRF